ncbi:unnamed protein product [Ectocarpus fasciculatus]
MFVGFGVNWFLRVVYVPYSHVFVEVFHYIGILRHGSDCDRCLRGGCCFFTEFFVLVFLCACLGPLPLAILLCWYLWRYLRHLCRFCIDLPGQAARRKTKLAVDRLRRFPDQKKWKARGWLIMMRARRQWSSTRSKGWPARLRKLERYDETNIIKDAMRVFQGGQTPPEIEQLEAGRLKMNFVRAVMAVVEINEEGLFRHIITYL